MSRQHIAYAGPIKGTYFFAIVDRFTKWPKVFKCNDKNHNRGVKGTVCKIKIVRNHCI